MKLLRFSLALIVITSMSLDAFAQKQQQVYVIVHGAWGGGWAWKRIDSLLTSSGNRVYRPTLTGLGERVHLATTDVGLSTHVQDVVNVMIFENLKNVILVGHSYGGMVISGVAHRVPDRITKLIYLDAFVPSDGESLMSIAGDGGNTFIKPMLKDGMVVPMWVKPDQASPKDVPHPFKAFDERVTMKSEAANKLPATYIFTIDPGKKPEEDGFYVNYQRAKSRGMKLLEMSADHNPQWSKPAELATLLLGEK